MPNHVVYNLTHAAEVKGARKKNKTSPKGLASLHCRGWHQWRYGALPEVQFQIGPELCSEGCQKSVWKGLPATVWDKAVNGHFEISNYAVQSRFFKPVSKSHADNALHGFESSNLHVERRDELQV
ncbi:unnamed protein product [Calypogeia fissa]